MRAPVLDDRLQVHCEWTGAPGASESVARLHGHEIMRNLGYQNRSVTDGVKDGKHTILTKNEIGYPNTRWSSTLFKAGHDYVMAFKARRISGTVRNLSGHAEAFTTRLNLLDGTPINGNWQNSLRVSNDTFPQDDEIHEVEVWLTFVGGVIDANLYVQPNRGQYGPEYSLDLWDFMLTPTSAPLPYFDGSTRDPEVLMRLYEASRDSLSLSENPCLWVLAC